MKKEVLFIILTIFIFYSGFGQVLEPVKWSYETKQTAEKEYQIIFKANIEKNWHLYSQYVPEGGPVKTSFYFYEIEGFRFLQDELEIIEEESFVEPGNMDYIAKFTEPEGHEEMDPNFDMVVKYFEHHAEFTRNIVITTSDPLLISGYMVLQYLFSISFIVKSSGP